MPETVLLLDDNPVVLMAAQSELEEHGFDVTTAETIRDFDKVLDTMEPDVIVLDVLMPDVLGDDVGMLLKEVRGTKAKVILLSGLGEEELSARAKAVNADGYYSKSQGLEGLPARIREVLSA